MNRYERYKDSGIPWLGEVPEHWDVKRLKFLGDIILGLTYSPENITNEDNGTLVLRSSNIQNGKLVFEDNVFVNSDIPQKMITTEQDILICSRNGSRSLIGKCALIEKYGLNQTFGAFMTVYRTPYRKFVYYALNSEIFKSQLGLFLTSTINQLTTQVLGNFNIAFPPRDEQTAIAHYLDTKLSEIDALIDKQQTLLEKLAEQRTAVITHAVTKGLDPSAPMKNSGVEWLGDVPAHWGVKRLKNSIDFSKNGIWGDEEKFDENDMYCLRVADFNRTNFTISETNLTIRNINPKDYESRKLKKGDLLLEKSGGGDKQPVGFVVLNTVAKKSVCSNFIAQLKLAENMNAQFWVYFHQFLYALRINVRSIKQSTGIQNLDETLYFNELACYPPFQEQTTIADYLNKETVKIDRLCETVNQTIGRLKEYRTALITQAVTGKIKVTDE